MDTLGEYLEFHLKSAVLILANISENFRDLCLKTYKLNSAHYFTTLSLSWHAMLRNTNI